jgi:ATP-binding cassette subfamily C protein LapB
MSLRSGEIVGVLGRVGSGKTPLGKLLTGLAEPENGIILIDGFEYQQYEPALLREGIGYLPQDPELFTGTIRENLILGKPDATEEEIQRALYFAGMDYFILENPEGLNQFVGEKGTRLSGGQRQALSLARLLLRKPKILFLDEPTNAMDHTTEAIVTDRLKELAQQDISMIISTHRHSLAAIASRLIVLDRGRKILDGPRDKVLERLAAPPVSGGKA